MSTAEEEMLKEIRLMEIQMEMISDKLKRVREKFFWQNLCLNFFHGFSWIQRRNRTKIR